MKIAKIFVSNMFSQNVRECDHIPTAVGTEGYAANLIILYRQRKSNRRTALEIDVLSRSGLIGPIGPIGPSKVRKTLHYRGRVKHVSMLMADDPITNAK
jgi:hypothetical protein